MPLRGPVIRKGSRTHLHHCSSQTRSPCAGHYDYESIRLLLSQAPALVEVPLPSRRHDAPARAAVGSRVTRRRHDAPARAVDTQKIATLKVPAERVADTMPLRWPVKPLGPRVTCRRHDAPARAAVTLGRVHGEVMSQTRCLYAGRRSRWCFAHRRRHDCPCAGRCSLELSAGTMPLRGPFLLRASGDPPALPVADTMPLRGPRETSLDCHRHDAPALAGVTCTFIEIHLVAGMMPLRGPLKTSHSASSRRHEASALADCAPCLTYGRRHDAPARAGVGSG
jgi:hypothetical protein